MTLPEPTPTEIADDAASERLTFLALASQFTVHPTGEEPKPLTSWLIEPEVTGDRPAHIPPGTTVRNTAGDAVDVTVINTSLVDGYNMTTPFCEFADLGPFEGIGEISHDAGWRLRESEVPTFSCGVPVIAKVSLDAPRGADVPVWALWDGHSVTHVSLTPPVGMSD